MKITSLLLLCVSALATVACKNGEQIAASPQVENGPALKDISTTAQQPEVVVYKNASCGCCKLWVEHLQSHGFPVKVSNVDNLQPIKEQAGVPPGLGSCHTAKVGDYFIEGHVPAADIQRLLVEKPRAKGLAVPGMPIGSPGMEQGDRVDPYEVLLVNEDGSTTVYAQHPPVAQVVQGSQVVQE